MEITEGKTGGIVVLTVKGRVDSSTAPALGDRLSATLAGAEKRVVVDLTETAYVSSAGLRVLLRAAEQARQTRGTLVLYGLNGRVAEVFDISGFSDLFTLCKTREEALGVAAR